MKIYNNLNISKNHKNSVIAIGNFDGIHSGHQKVIAQAKKRAKKNKLPLGLITFEPMPMMFFNSKVKNHRINSLAQKKIQLEKFKLDFLIIIKLFILASLKAVNTSKYLSVMGCLAKFSLSGKCNVKPPFGPPQNGISFILLTSFKLIPIPVVKTETLCPCS